MKKLFLIVFTGIFAIAFTACQSSQTTKSNTNQNNSTMNMNDTNQNSVAEDLKSMKNMKGSIMENSPDAASAPYDLQFLDTMAAHHQGAVDMAKPIVAKSDNAELKAFAAKIIADQNKEIAQMKNWREKWFEGRPPAMNMEMPGMMDSMMGMNMKKMAAPGGNLLDLRFLDMMTMHHQGAITMSKEALDRAEHAEIKTLANQIIKAQEAEIKQMQEWKTAWSK
jgi:uncharacterized protein (DUF305 family)